MTDSQTKSLRKNFSLRLFDYVWKLKSVSFEDIAGVDFVGDILEACVIAVGEDGVGEAFELGEVIYHSASEECGAVFKCGLVDDDRGTFCLDALHHALD